MMPPHYLSTIAEERQRELRDLAQPFVVPKAIITVRGRLSSSLIRRRNALASAGDAARAGLPTH